MVSLDLSQRQMPDEGRAALLTCSPEPLQHLSLSGLNLTAALLRPLSGHQALATVNSLDLTSCLVAPDVNTSDLAPLWGGSLELLNLAWSQIGDLYIPSICQTSPVRVLLASGVAGFSDVSLQIIETGQLPMLTHVDVRETGVSEAGVSQLLQTRPNLKLCTSWKGSTATAADIEEVAALGCPLMRAALQRRRDEQVTQGKEAEAHAVAEVFPLPLLPRKHLSPLVRQLDRMRDMLSQIGRFSHRSTSESISAAVHDEQEDVRQSQLDQYAEVTPDILLKAVGDGCELQDIRLERLANQRLHEHIQLMKRWRDDAEVD